MLLEKILKTNALLYKTLDDIKKQEIYGLKNLLIKSI